ncbi:hypothetical protein ACLI1C_02375 [Devosia sp. XGJD_8]|uniref:hypothetical protein n=1 Tax=Devosia sp. XGJD_8 TaxID=3391187 RepID=UPI003984CF87
MTLVSPISDQKSDLMSSKLPIDVRWRRATEKAKIAALVLACRIGGSKFAAEFMASRADAGDWKPNRPTVVAFYRPLFSKDLAELRKRTDVNWVYLNNQYLGHVQSAWCPLEMRVQTKYQMFHDEAHAKVWASLQRFGDDLVVALRRRFPVDAFMTSHIDYWQCEGARLGAKRAGIPFLGLCREHMCLPIEQRSVTKYYTGFKYEGDSIAVFGESTRKIFIESGACAPEQVVVTGPPRLDLWTDIDTASSSLTRVVLLSYRDPDYRAPHNFGEVLALFLTAAQTHSGSGIEFVIKAKNPQDVDEIRGRAGKMEKFVTIDHQVPLTELLPTARLIVGFNSLSVLEAQFCVGQTVVPFWGDARRPDEELIFTPSDAATARVIAFPESADALRALLANSARPDWTPAPVSTDDKNHIISQIFYQPPQGNSSQAVEAYVRQAIAEGPSSVAR